MATEDCGPVPPTRNINPNHVLVHVRTTIPKEQSDALDHRAIEEGTSKQQLIRNAIEVSLRRTQKEEVP